MRQKNWKIEMGLGASYIRWDKFFRLSAAFCAIIAILFLPNIRPVYAMPGGNDDSYALEQCISFNVQPTDIPDELDRLCGKLVILKDLKVEIYYLGLEVCGSGQVLIFQTRPRELQKYYQFREAEIGRGAEILTDSGIYNQYIVTFKNYIPLNSCAECGRVLTPTPRELVPTPQGTQNLVFPTPTSRQPTVTRTSTASPTATAFSPTSLSPTSLSPTSPVQATEVPASPSATQTLIANTTPPTPTFQKTPPPGDNTSGLPDNTMFIFSGVAVAFIVTLGVGIFYMQRRQR